MIIIFASLIFICCTDQKVQPVADGSLNNIDTFGTSETGRITDSLVKSGPEVPDQRANIDSIVYVIDNNNQLATHRFSIVAMKKVFHVLTYEYKKKKDKIQKIRRQFTFKRDTIIQEFYLQDDELVFARETELSFFTEGNVTDTMMWRGEFYYAKGRLIDYITLGHGKSEEEWWDPETAMQTPYRDSRRDIQRHLKRN